MTERPLLKLPEPEPVAPPRAPSGGPKMTRPGRERQHERLAPRFARLAKVAGDPQQAMQLRADVEAIAPERAIVFELAGSISEFSEKAASIGLEYLADDERDFEPDEPVRFEVELWFRDNPEVRARAFTAFATNVQALDGAIVDHVVIPEVRYDAALIDLPAIRIRALMADPTVSLARFDEIMYIRPQSMAEFPVDDEAEEDPISLLPAAPLRLPPIAALLDGYPVQNHHRLVNRLVIDDPDGLEERYVVAARKHGTEMASLILHGDINQNEPPLRRPIYVRPVLRPVRTHNGWEERTPSDRLLVDVIYRAVRRMWEGDGEEPATAPTVLLVNLSLGDQHRPFTGRLSPWARLLDFLSFRYRVLFLVSAGNVTDPLALPGFAT